MRPPDMDELPDYWYVVDHGREVGIFADRCVLRLSSQFRVLKGMHSESANNAVAGVVGGHQIRVGGWLEAANLYNELHRQGNVILVHTE
jgi:hypothetical protein